MSVTKSILESFELESGQTAYIQSSSGGGIALSFDSGCIQVMQSLTIEEAIELASKLNQVVGEVALNDTRL